MPLRMRVSALVSCAFLALSGCMGDPMRPDASPPAGPAQILDVSAQSAAEINALRARNGLGALGTDPVLANIARGHAEDMLENRFFGHVSSDGRTIVERTREAGYAFCHVAENLALRQTSLTQVLDQWMTSPSHRRNVLHQNVDDFGLVRGPGNIWVLVLGRPGC